MSAELEIDWTRCQGRGLCIELLATDLTSDPWGYPLARRADGHQSGTVILAEDQREAADEAVKMCPLSALKLRTNTHQ
ncbi:ferredoxin [Glutamicibacter ectropisis]|uniref:Ferredoxin n=1 Tax=Glutamicibacter ectropisis TaxID=3046593 RepID=A0AAU6WCA3_9MICC